MKHISRGYFGRIRVMEVGPRYCANCGSARGWADGSRAACPDCEWPLGLPVPDAPFCSICRRRHGADTTHACE
jgi:hypothetical protein